MSDLYLLFYASRMSTGVNDHLWTEITDILKSATRLNADNGVTGLLIAHRGWFVQALEGREQAVRDRFAAIVRDPRHHDVTVLGQGPTLARVFDGWSMCARVISASDRKVLDLLGRMRSFDPLRCPTPKVFQLLTTVAAVQRKALTP